MSDFGEYDLADLAKDLEKMLPTREERRHHALLVAAAVLYMDPYRRGTIEDAIDEAENMLTTIEKGEP